MYKSILDDLHEEFSFIYKKINKAKPSLSVSKKQALTLQLMTEERGTTLETFEDNAKKLAMRVIQASELTALICDITEGVTRYYLEDDSLFDFFKNTELQQKEIDRICEGFSEYQVFGILGKSFSCTVVISKPFDFWTIAVLSEKANLTFVPGYVELKNDDDRDWFNMIMNFMLYREAFPEKIIDGTPKGEKKTPNGKFLGISEKICTTGHHEHKGFVKPHFRRGYFRHLESDWYKNCKGKTQFIAGTVVKGRAKTVLE